MSSMKMPGGLLRTTAPLMEATGSRSGPLLLITVAALVALTAAPAAAADSGKDVFIAQSCNDCHTIESEGIALGEGAEEEEDAEDAPDLSDVGSEYEKVWIAKYLLKQVDKDGEKHKKRFRGSKQELVQVATWLATLKDE